MAAELTVDRFLSLVERSSLVSHEQMEKLQEEFSGQPGNLDNSRKIAKELVSRGVLTTWQATMLLQGKYKGFILGPYHILKPLGKGGMGAVFLAEHKMLKRRSAIKVLPSGYDKEGSSLLDRFYREAQAVAALDHRNIVRAYDVNSSVENKKEIHYLVMEYVDGQDLQKVVSEQGALGYRHAADIIRQAADGLAHAHQAGLVHRDVKPANLLVDSNGVVKLLDLGLARFFDDAAAASLTNDMGDTVLGTADYLAPEQALDSHDVDARADIYSLGQTFYFLLTGHPPFPSGTVAERLLAHQLKAPEPISKSRPDAPRSLLAIIDKMIAKKREVRYQSAEEVSQVLCAWLKDRGEDSGPLRRATPLPDTGQESLTSHRDPTHPSSSPTEDTGLELAFLDDEQRSLSSSIKLDPTRGDSRLSTPKSGNRISPSSSGSRISLIPGGAKASSSGSQAKKSVADSKPPSQEQPAPAAAEDFDVDDLDDGGDYKLAGELEDLPPLESQSDPDAALAQDDPLSDIDSLPAGDPLAGPPKVPGATKKPSPAKFQTTKVAPGRPKSTSASVMDSPWFWIGAVGVAGVVVIGLVLAIVLSGSEEPVEPPTVTQQEAAGEQSPPATGTAEDDTGTQRSEAAVEAKEPKQPEEPAGPPKDEKGSAKDRSQDKPPKAEPKSPSAPPQQQPATPAKEETKDAHEKSQPTVKPAEPTPKPATPRAKGPAAKPKPQPSKRLSPLARRIAGIKSVSVKFDFPSWKPNRPYALMIEQKLSDALGLVGIAVSDKGDAELNVTFDAVPEDQQVKLVISGKLVCPGGKDKQGVAVWESEQETTPVAPHLLQAPAVNLTVRKDVGDFFTKFVGDVRRARAEIEEN